MSSDYAKPDVLVSTEWVANNLDAPNTRILESNEDDNHSYAFIEVTPLPLREVRVLERGYGSDPWDPAKQVLVSTP
jgi:hypothetical protein